MLAPKRMVPVSGGLAPVSMSISVVLPAPLGPTMPMRSPRCTRIEKSSTILRSPYDLPMCLASMMSLPDLSYGDRKIVRSEEHTSELQSLTNLVCRLLLEKKKKDLQRPFL